MECKVEGHMSGMVAKSPARQACRRILLENNIWEEKIWSLAFTILILGWLLMLIWIFPVQLN